MKKVIVACLIMVFLFCLNGCSNPILKSEYEVNEEGILDNINITLLEAKIIENDIIEFVFKITNKTDNTISLSPDINFKLYDINKVQIPNVYLNNKNIIKKGETINYTLQYNSSKKELYHIFFYSGVVENNIKFTITSLDINHY